MPKLPSLSGRDIIQALGTLGFQPVRQRGSHVVLSNGNRQCVVPLHNPVKVGTLKSVLRQANVDVESFLSALDN